MFGIGRSTPTVTLEEVKQALDARNDAVVLDVRSAEEYARGHIADSSHVPLDTIQDRAENVLKNKQKTIYVYCFSGSRSSIATEILKKLGYKNVFNMTGGLLAWRAKNYSISFKA